MYACFQFNMCLRNMVFKHPTTKQFEYFLAGFDAVPHEKSKMSRWKSKF